MTNLLPLTLRERQANQRLLVLLATIGLVCMSVALFVAAALLPAYLAASAEIKNIQARLSGPEKERALVVKKEKEAVLGLKKTIDALTDIGRSGTGVSMIERIVTTRPSGTAVTAITFTSKGATSTLLIDGTAATRDAVIMFVNEVEKMPGVISAEVPITSLAKADDTIFHMTVTGIF